MISLAQLRGAEGRSLAKALAVLFFLATLLAGLNSGLAAGAAVSGEVVCAWAPSHPDGSPGHAPDDHLTCCLTTCASGPLALPSVEDAIWVAPMGMPKAFPPTAIVLPLHRAIAREGPRGPPVLV